ncbi:MAG: hypothetical protein CMF12_13975 [Idiomarina sp.]|uniref:hypothetical protein n=1 Tax=Idiomarina sp. TaxID=1874361 RepID=UPI000C504AE8|nr:hypothetical protein [Idiomarina sp.]MBT43614.1 hypothetical protein [Idiomarina sp.]
MNYTALYTSYIDRALLAIKLSPDVSDDIWGDYFGIDDGDIERTLWSNELAEKITELNLGDLPLSIFCYEVLETHLVSFFQNQYVHGQSSALSSAVTCIMGHIEDMQDVLNNGHKKSQSEPVSKIWARIGAYVFLNKEQEEMLKETHTLPAGVKIEFDGENYIVDDNDELNEVEFAFSAKPVVTC